MQTKDVLLVVGGVALGYLASRMNWGSRTATAVGDVGKGALGVATAIVTDVKDVAVDTVKMAQCEKNLSEALMTVKIDAESMESFKKNFLAECMSIPSGTGGLKPSK
jgi:hypothetical protein